MKKIFEMYGGSKAYHLDTPESDTDIRYVFLNTDKSRIIGLDRYEHQDVKSATEDSFGFELRHFLNLLRKTNTQVLEILFAEEFISQEPEFSVIYRNRYELLDSEKFFKSLMGYIQGERRLMMGQRTGDLGSKRREALEKYGYSYKNSVQLLRLTFCGTYFFKYDNFPVDISKFPDLHKELMGIKLDPTSRNKDEILAETYEMEEVMKRAFDNRQTNFEFNLGLANDICCDLYKQFFV